MRAIVGTGLFILLLGTGTLHGSPVTYEDSRIQSILGSSELTDFSEIYSDANLTVPEIIEKYGFPVEVHHVTTEDGYILELHRIPYGIECGPEKGNKRVVFIQHGLLCDSSNFVMTGVQKGLAYRLADACYDVWLGNARGNTYSRNHTTLSPDTDKSLYWNFSWNEMGIYDLPANFDYILEITGQEKLFYIGHSMGTTMFWVCMSERPEYNEKIILMSALAPVAYTEHMISPIRLIAPFSSEIEWLLTMFGMYEFLPSNEFLEYIGQLVCQEQSPYQSLCANVLFLLCGFDPDQLDPALLPEIFGHLPAGTSVPSVVHYAQGVTSTSFMKYDYGPEKNLEVYGQISPPEYDLSKITAPVALYWAENDWLGAKADTIRIAAMLPNLQRMYRIDHDKFNHLDFIFATDIVSLVNHPVTQFMQSF